MLLKFAQGPEKTIREPRLGLSEILEAFSEAEMGPDRANFKSYFVLGWNFAVGTRFVAKTT